MTKRTLLLLIFSHFFLTACGMGVAGDLRDGITGLTGQDQDPIQVLASDQGKQPISFDVEENIAYMNGVMDSTFEDLVSTLLEEHPQVDTIVMQNVPGTLDFDATLNASYLIREACLTTVIPDNGYIASGGVYFFLAGCERYADRNSFIGIHTWRTYTVDQNDEKRVLVTAAELARDDPAHQKYLDFHHDMEISEDFYWMIVDTPFDDVYYLKHQDIEEYELATLVDDWQQATTN